jgi:hypothetical protein
MEAYGWRADEMKMFRMATAGKNIRYSVVRAGSGLKEPEHDGFIANMVGRSGARSGILQSKEAG